MNYLNLKDYFNFQIIYDSKNELVNEDDYLNTYIYYEKDYFPYKILKVNELSFNFKIIDKYCIKCNSQTIQIKQNNIRKIAIAGACMMFHYNEKIKLIYDDGTIEIKSIYLDDMLSASENFLKYLYGIQKEEVEKSSHILWKGKNAENNINYYLYYDVVSIENTKKLESIQLPNNDLMYIFAITLY